MLQAILAFAFVLGLLVLAHELGHFVVAKRTGIKVEEFGIGYPPRLLTVAQRGDTKYTINLLPVGGFVKMLGEEDPTHPDSFASKSRMVRATTLVAGPLMNVVLAVVLFSLVLVVGIPMPVGDVVIEEVVSGTPAEAAGVQAGDVVLTIDGLPVRNSGELVRFTHQRLGQEVALQLKRGEETLDLYLIPRARPPEGQGPMGIVINTDVKEISTLRFPPWEAIALGIVRTVGIFLAIFFGIIHTIQGLIAPDVAGPIRIAQMTGEVARSGLINLLEFAGILSVNLAIINMLPIPALDGGRLMFVALEALRGGKRIAPEKEGFVHFLGMLFLLSLMLMISYFDLLQVFNSGGRLP
ncbi:MAG: RIP metalloprotease RseP [Anaerolineae bacterium]